MNHHSATWKIIAKNTFTLFNLVNVILAVMVALVGSYKNMLFIGIAIANTLISIVNGIRAKRIVDKLKLLSEQRPKVQKNGKIIEVDPSQVKPGDPLELSLGDQVLFDSEITSGTCEVNESFITGEQESIARSKGDHLTSGSFLTSGAVTAKVLRIGSDNFVTKLQAEASTIKTADSQLFSLMNKIVKYISYTLIPIGALLLWARFRTEADATTAVTSTVAALINMIPEGLILLTSSVLALATIRLSRKKVLVQDLYAIETLARVDTICLDKTGTLTTGHMTVHDYKACDDAFLPALAAILKSQPTDTSTITALKAKFTSAPGQPATALTPTSVIPFSSDRKYSGIVTEDATYLLGAIEFITDDKSIIKKVKRSSNGYRTLALVKQSESAILQHSAGPDSHFHNSRGRAAGTEIPGRVRPTCCENDDRGPRTLQDGTSDCSCQLLGFIRLEDEIRPTAHQIIRYFKDNDIAVKIISGDDLTAVTEIAKRVGLRDEDLKGVDLSTLKSKDYDSLTKKYSIFTRVTPTEKKDLVKALKRQQKTVAMTGDGVNDILAMKEADVSLSIGDGADAARRASKFVLLDSGYEAVPSIIDEGRQSINNLERSTSLFLAKTVYASLLAVLFVVLPLNYPYTPIEMSLLNFACIGFPGLVLALEHNTARIKNKFITNIKHYSVPTGITVAVSMLVLSIVATVTGMNKPLLTTLSATITAVINLVLIYQISKPLNLFRAALLVLIAALLAATFLLPLTRAFFEFI